MKKIKKVITGFWMIIISFMVNTKKIATSIMLYAMSPEYESQRKIKLEYKKQMEIKRNAVLLKTKMGVNVAVCGIIAIIVFLLGLLVIAKKKFSSKLIKRIMILVIIALIFVLVLVYFKYDVIIECISNFILGT